MAQKHEITRTSGFNYKCLECGRKWTPSESSKAERHNEKTHPVVQPKLKRTGYYCSCGEKYTKRKDADHHLTGQGKLK